MIEAAARRVVQVDQRDQHQQRAGKRVEEELDRRVDAIGAAPNADDHVHRDQRRFEEHIEQQAIGGGEDADHQRRTGSGRPRSTAATRVFDHLPAREHDEHRHERGQQNEPDRNAVDAEVVVRVQRARSRTTSSTNCMRCIGGVETDVQRNRDEQGRAGCRPARARAITARLRSRPAARIATPKTIGIQIARLSQWRHVLHFLFCFGSSG